MLDKALQRCLLSNKSDAIIDANMQCCCWARDTFAIISNLASFADGFSIANFSSVVPEISYLAVNRLDKESVLSIFRNVCRKNKEVIFLIANFCFTFVLPVLRIRNDLRKEVLMKLISQRIKEMNLTLLSSFVKCNWKSAQDLRSFEVKDFIQNSCDWNAARDYPLVTFH